MTRKHPIFDRVREMYRDGKTKREIANETGLTYEQVRNACYHPSRKRRATGVVAQIERERKRLLAQSDDPEWRRVVISNFGEA